jgi:hypothetical protein
LEKNKRALLDDLKGLDGIEEQRPLSSEDILSKEAATIELEKIILLEECWRKKKVVLWLRGGKNTKFFNRVASSNRKCNTIENLVINGDISFNPD